MWEIFKYISFKYMYAICMTICTCICMYMHRYQYVNSITHVDIILLNIMRHQWFVFFLPWNCCWAENSSAGVQMRYWATRISVFNLPLLQVIWLSQDYLTQAPVSHSNPLNHSDGHDKASAELLPWRILCMTSWTLGVCKPYDL